MNIYQISDNFTLDNYILAKELMRLANLSPNAFRYWKKCVAVKYYKSRVVFLHKKYIHEKYTDLIDKCSSLEGLVQSSAFCRCTNLSSSHLTKSNHSKIYDILNIEVIEGIKFINFKKFLAQYNLDYTYTVYIEKCKYFAPLEKKIKLTKKLCLGYY